MSSAPRSQHTDSRSTGPAPASQTGSPLDGRRAVVTGGGSGIGEAACRALADAGATVVVLDRDEDNARRVADDIGGEAVVADLLDTDALASLDLGGEHGAAVDILVNNAGIQKVAPIPDFPLEDFRRIQTIMVEAPFVLVKSVLPGMYERGFGRIVHVSSVHGLRASAFKSGYVTAKHAIEGFSKVTALEGAEHGVTSNCVNPGYVLTPLVEKQIADQAAAHGIGEQEVVEKVFLQDTAIKRMAEPSEVGALVAFLCGPQAGMITGSSYVMDGGWTAH